MAEDVDLVSVFEFRSLVGHGCLAPIVEKLGLPLYEHFDLTDAGQQEARHDVGLGGGVICTGSVGLQLLDTVAFVVRIAPKGISLNLKGVDLNPDGVDHALFIGMNLFEGFNEFGKNLDPGLKLDIGQGSGAIVTALSIGSVVEAGHDSDTYGSAAVPSKVSNNEESTYFW